MRLDAGLPQRRQHLDRLQRRRLQQRRLAPRSALTRSTTGAMVLYIDGLSSNGDTATGSTAALSATPALSFGRSADTQTRAYVGHLDDASLYNVVLNSTQVNAHRNAGIGQ